MNNELNHFHELGTKVEAGWRQANYDDSALAEIACRCLQDANIAVSYSDLIAWLLTSQNLPQQYMDGGNRFGQPPFSVYESDELVVQLLFWNDGTTAIHEHNFTGAFAVLHGGSLHSRFRFVPRRAWTDRLQVGELSLETIEVLLPGDIRPILIGASSLHSLFHLDMPTVSIVVRSQCLAKSRPQISMNPPGLGLDPFHQPRLALRRRMLIQQLVKNDEVVGLSTACDYLLNTDAFDAVVLVLALSRHLKPAAGKQLVDQLAAKHGPELAIVQAVSAEAKRSENLTARRAKITDKDQRFLLALLLNVPDRARILTLIEDHISGTDPAAWIMARLTALQSQAIEEADDEAGLGFDLDQASTYVLEHLLRGQSEAEILALFDAADPPSGFSKGQVQKACLVLPHLKVLKPLFA